MVGALTGYIDIAQVVLYAFWLFFAGLVFYLHRENKREGYPLETERGQGSRVSVRGFPDMPPPKVFHHHDGRDFVVPLVSSDRRDAAVEMSAEWPGSPFAPTGDPMRDGVGPASYADREDVPEVGIEGRPIIMPLRIAHAHTFAPDGPNPIGYRVLGADGLEAGIVRDAWIDEAESLIRYLEVEAGSRRVLLPMAMSRVRAREGVIKVASILASQFAGVPATKSPDQVTKREEDRIVGYFAGGHLYATPSRMGPLL